MIKSPLQTLMLFSLINGILIVGLMKDASLINYFYLEVGKEIELMEGLKLLENLMVQMENYLVMLLKNGTKVKLNLEPGIIMALKERMID